MTPPMRMLLLILLVPVLTLLPVNMRGGAGSPPENPEAMYHHALMYERGFDTIPADTTRMLELLRESAGKGYLPAANYLGYYLIKSGRGAEGLRWLEEAAIAGDPKAQSNIGFMLLDGSIVKRDEEKAVFWLERSAAAGQSTAASMLGDLYRDGRGGLPRDTAMAAAHYFAALDHGLTDAAYKLESMLHEEWVALSPEEQLELALYFYPSRAPQVAMPILRRVAESENKAAAARASALLGDAYTRGLGVAYDHDASLLHYWRAAEAGYPPAMFVVAELLEIFPDALTGLTDDAPAPALLREEAAAAGVLTAEDATAMLFAASVAVEEGGETGNTERPEIHGAMPNEGNQETVTGQGGRMQSGEREGYLHTKQDTIKTGYDKNRIR